MLRNLVVRYQHLRETFSFIFTADHCPYWTGAEKVPPKYWYLSGIEQLYRSRCHRSFTDKICDRHSSTQCPHNTFTSLTLGNEHTKIWHFIPHTCQTSPSGQGYDHWTVTELHLCTMPTLQQQPSTHPCCKASPPMAASTFLMTQSEIKKLEDDEENSTLHQKLLGWKNKCQWNWQSTQHTINSNCIENLA